MAFECRLLGVVRLSIIGRFVFLESAIFRRFVWDFSEIWICGLYIFLSEEEPEDKLKYTYNGYYEDNKSYDEEQSKSMHN